MQNIFQAAHDWCKAGDQVALATVIKTWGSAPRGVGAKMIVRNDGEMLGSVSGGCVEGAVVAVGMQVAQSGAAQLLHYGVQDATAWEVGLACGGEIDIFVERVNLAEITFLLSKWQAGEKLVKVSVVAPESVHFGASLITASDGQVAAYSQNAILATLSQAALTASASFSQISELDGQKTRLLLDVILPPQTLIIVGGVHIAIPLVSIASVLGFRTIVIDPRKKFASQSRFPHADQIINAWPQKAFSQIRLNSVCAVAVLSHDPKIDDPALALVLPSAAFYVGALGSKTTQLQRRARLLDFGLTLPQVDRISGPIGLNLGGRSPEEIALAIMAEIVQVQHRTTN